MKVSDFRYELPPELIAQRPADRRDRSRMLVLNRASGASRITRFAEFADLLTAGDCLVVNNTRVIPARLLAVRDPSGGCVEALLVDHVGGNRWHCFLKPGRHLKPGDRVCFPDRPGEGYRVRERLPESGLFEIEFEGGAWEDLVERHGHVPLPPYIRRADAPEDRDRYQTVFAERPGAVAAPTAGLHFTSAILDRLAERGVRIGQVTLHVGPGTFRPVQVHDVRDHAMHEETFELPAKTADLVNATREAGGRVVAVGTTCVRVLESCAAPNQRRVLPQSGRTRLFLHPPQQPRVTDALLTNFHLPRSTLLMLVCTFADTAHVLAAYRRAVRERLRFYSYGDCMFLA